MTCNEDTLNGKPDPEIYLLACERAGCHVFAVPDILPLPQDVVDDCEAVLDTLFDLTAAVRAVR